MFKLIVERERTTVISLEHVRIVTSAVIHVEKGRGVSSVKKVIKDRKEGISCALGNLRASL